MPSNYYISDLKNLHFSDGSSVLDAKQVNYMWDLLESYDDHKIKSDQGSVILEGFDQNTGLYVKKHIPILYRTDQRYKRRLLAKLYCLDDWYNGLSRTDKVVSMVTLTTKQRGLSFFDQYDMLRLNWCRMRDLIRKQNPDANYIAIWEPHKTGYAHIHIAYFGVNFSNSYISKIKALWAHKYGVGGNNALDVSNKRVGSLKCAKNYIMKYLVKGLSDDGTDKIKRIGDSDLKSSIDDKGIHFKIFNAVLWYISKHDTDYVGIRSFQPSRLLSRVMSADSVISTIRWVRGWFHYGNDLYPLFDHNDRALGSWAHRCDLPDG